MIGEKEHFERIIELGLNKDKVLISLDWSTTELIKKINHKINPYEYFISSHNMNIFFDLNSQLNKIESQISSLPGRIDKEIEYHNSLVDKYNNANDYNTKMQYQEYLGDTKMNLKGYKYDRSKAITDLPYVRERQSDVKLIVEKEFKKFPSFMRDVKEKNLDSSLIICICSKEYTYEKSEFILEQIPTVNVKVINLEECMTNTENSSYFKTLVNFAHSYEIREK